MKLRGSWRAGMLVGLLAASAATYVLHFFIFRDPKHIFIYLIGDVAFMFINVLVVTLVIEQILAAREKRVLIKKLNMVIGTFFSDVGLELLRHFGRYVENTDDLSPRLRFTNRWEKRDFQAAIDAARTFEYRTEAIPATLRELRRLLLCHRDFLLRLLENPNLLEHDRFTDLLWAVFHLLEELEMREESYEGLPAADYLHLAGDIKRAFSQIAAEWLAYAQHLKASYPFLYSLASRINPFNPEASPVVKN
ncbi:MAG: hypothetical protein FJY80_14705 [Candidatus Aminicenantes bacterium]|nr:hypothetical protein [Candidatus Aminicenantes bacterium]